MNSSEHNIEKIIGLSCAVFGILAIAIGSNRNNEIASLLGFFFMMLGFIMIYLIEKEEQKRKNLKEIELSGERKKENNSNVTTTMPTQACENNFTTLINEDETTEYVNTNYKPPIGYEISEWTTTATKIRGCEHCVEEKTEIYEFDDVEIVHEPNDEYFENTNIYIEDELVGKLKKDMAIDWVKRYGENYKFFGQVIEYTYDDYPTLIIKIIRPVLRKIKKSSKKA